MFFLIGVRTQQEIFSLDEELNLFDEVDWDFLNVSETAENYEYYNDIRDLDFEEESALGIFKNELVPLIILGIITILSIILSLGVLGVFKKSQSYESILSMESSEKAGSNTMNYVDGNECSNSDMVAISKTLSNYCGILKTKSNYNDLNSICSESTFASSYKGYTDSIKESYDINDCYARGFSQFGSFISVNKIDRVIEKDGTYYCYVYLNVPTSENIFQYVYMHQYDIAKYFTNRSISEDNIIRYLIDTTEQSAITTTSVGYCIEFEKQGESLVLKDDKVFTDDTINSFKEATSQVTSVIKGNMKNN